jgi:hypothetical protein
VQIAEQDVQAVDAPRVLGNQVLAALSEAQDRGVVFELDAVEASVVLGYRRDRDGVGDGYEVEMAEQTALVRRPAADALAELLGMQGRWLSMFEDTWMIQASAESNGGTAD